MQTAAGAAKARQTLITKHGSYEAYVENLRKTASKGGKTPTTKPKGFAAMSPEKRRESGAKGGRVSKRTKATPDFTNPDYSSEVHTTVYFTRSARVAAFLRTVTGRV